MKKFIIIFLLMLAVVALVSSTASAAGKPLKALISGARICIVEGRPDEALILLDSALVQYGPVPEAYQWAFLVYQDKLDGAATLEAKRPLLASLLAYIDSLHQTCDGVLAVEDKKYLKDCKKFIQLADSTKEKYYRLFYKAGRDQITSLSRMADDLAAETDSSRREYIQSQIDENIDSVIANMDMAIMVNATEYSTYVAIGDAYNRAGDPARAAEWMMKGYELADSSNIIAKQLAYLYIDQEDYCAAVPYLEGYVRTDTAAADRNNMLNYLAVCLNNCSLEPGNEAMLDSAMAINRQLLAANPTDVNLLGTFGRYYLVQAQQASAKASDARQADNEAEAKQFDSRRKEMFDSSYTYFKQAWDLDTTNAQNAEQYGFTAMLREDCTSAIKAFEVVAAARPSDADNWLSLGDCYLRLADFPNATRAYEKVVELSPEKSKVWENLAALYRQAGNSAKADEAAKKAREVSGGQG